jgi:hypothetical protein
MAHPDPVQVLVDPIKRQGGHRVTSRAAAYSDKGLMATSTRGYFTRTGVSGIGVSVETVD